MSQTSYTQILDSLLIEGPVVNDRLMDMPYFYA